MSDNNDGGAVASEEAIVAGVGPQLRAAREARGLSLAQVAAQTRIGQDNLQRIEEGEFHRLPGRIYAIGFAKSYAKAVGLDQNDVAAMVRMELGEEPSVVSRGSADFLPGDPARAPSGRLVWFSVLAVALLVVGLYFAAKVLMDPAAQIPSLTEQRDAEQAAAQSAREAAAASAAQPINVGGAVVLTAAGGAVWLRVTDEADQRLMEGELAEGRSYTIPANAKGPKLITGRPDMLTITVGGRAVPKISEDNRTVVDVPVDAASLLARSAPTATPSASSSVTASPTTPRAAATGD